MKRIAYLFPILLLALAGCETAAERLEEQAARSIQPGVTTRLEILRDFGAPQETISGDGRTLLFYYRYYWASPTGPGYGPTRDSYAVGLSVLLDRNDRVVRSLHSSHPIRMIVGAGSVSAGNELADELLARIRPDVTTRAEAISILGEPTMESLNTAGQVVVDWAYSRANYISGPAQFRMLRVLLNEHDVVVAIKNINDR